MEAFQTRALRIPIIKIEGFLLRGMAGHMIQSIFHAVSSTGEAHTADRRSAQQGITFCYLFLKTFSFEIIIDSGSYCSENDQAELYFHLDCLTV
jgi:hypothetical protein